MQARQFKQLWFTLLTHAFIAWLTISFFRSIQQSNPVDNTTVYVYEIYGFIAIALLTVATGWIIIKMKKFAQNILSGLFLILNISVYFFGLTKVEDLPYEQRFVLKNNTAYPLTDLKIIGDTVIQVGTLQPNQQAKVTYSNYIENSSIDLACNYGQAKATLNLVAGLTNSIGYLHEVSIKVVNDKLNVDITH
jgi:flagellar biosynthesis protein FliQ